MSKKVNRDTPEFREYISGFRGGLTSLGSNKFATMYDFPVTKGQTFEKEVEDYEPYVDLEGATSLKIKSTKKDIYGETQAALVGVISPSEFAIAKANGVEVENKKGLYGDFTQEPSKEQLLNDYKAIQRLQKEGKIDKSGNINLEAFEGVRIVDPKVESGFVEEIDNSSSGEGEVK